MSKKIIAGAVAAAIIGMVPMTASAVNMKDVMAGKTDLSIGGFIKVDALWGNYSDGDSSYQKFYTGGVATGNGSAGESGSDLDMTARASRINFKTSTKIDGHKLVSFIEMDFLGSAAGNESVTNAYEPRLRHAFLMYDNWKIGQTWSNFMDLGALPASVDFLGPSESVVFMRQPLIQYTSGAWSVSLENPQTLGAGDPDDNDLPDLIAKYTHKADFGHVSLAAIVREMEDDVSQDDSVTGWGLSLAGKINVGAKDNIKFQLSGGEGPGRYIGLAKSGDVKVDASGDLEAVELIAGYVAYHHAWTDKTSSNVIYSRWDRDEDTSIAGLTGANSETHQSLQINFMYSPVKPLTFGAMYLRAENELYDGTDGDADLIQFSAKYAF